MKRIFLAALAAFTVLSVSAQYKAPQIIANAGFHKHASSGVKNSMSALKAAQKAKFYGSECDVNLTKDGYVLVVQSGWHPHRKAKPKADVQRSTKEKMLEIPYTNGEYICTLEQYLKRAAKKPATKLILDLKNQANPQRETELVESVLDIVARAGMQENVEYLADHPWTCFELAKKAPKESKIQYLAGNYDPAYVKAMGCSGIDYNFKVLKKKKGWIKQAHKLGLTVNVWTVNKEEDIRWCIQNGVDFITTDDPVLVKNIIKEMCPNKKK
ncbi:MAG: glycerophosphodiester phosphodiesterase [Rikenellaceae bacterium]|nr:glycerophosphodiester phosphodiesterase [Rikenellaceae bacterium]